MKAIEKRRQMAGQGGFTLIELLVVIAILGILAAVVVFAVGGITDNGQDAACKIEARSVTTAIGAYRAQNSTYPTALTDITGGQFLEEAPTLLTYTPDATGVTRGSAVWAGKCSTMTGTPWT
ncbi:MAG: type II secretion system protein [Microthrixaceae bacterium]